MPRRAQEKDPVRGGDSFAAFEEVLLQSKAQKADLLLLGGDLFHDNKPSRNTLHRCERLSAAGVCSPPRAHAAPLGSRRRTFDILRNHTLGDDPVQFQVSARARDMGGRARGVIDVAGSPPSLTRARAQQNDRRPVGRARGDTRRSSRTKARTLRHRTAR